MTRQPNPNGARRPNDGLRCFIVRRPWHHVVRPGNRGAAVLAALMLAVSPAARAAEPATNLIANGGFDRADPADPGRPAGWDLPDGLGVQWTNDPAAPERGRAIRMDTRISEQEMVAQWRRGGIDQWDIPKPERNPIAATYGLSFYSASFPVASGQAYRVEFDCRGPSGGSKVWVRGWGMFHGEKRRRYETIVFCRGAADRWDSYSQCFHPTRLRPEVTEMRVMLYAYWPPGLYWFDNVRVVPVSEAVYERDRETGRR